MIVTNTDFWDDPPRLRHQLSDALAENYEVWFVSANRTGLPTVRHHVIRKNLHILVPSYPIDYRLRYRMSFLNRHYQNWLYRRLRAELSGRSCITITFDNTSTELWRYFPRTVYYCNDYNIRYYYFNFIRRYLEHAEEVVARKAMLCAATSEYLVNRLSAFNDQVLELRHGAPRIDFEPGFSRAQCIRLGLVGFLNASRVSIPLIEKLASHSEVRLCLIGPVDEAIRTSANRFRNIELRGVLTGQELMRALDEVDVGIAPYRIEDINAGGTPNKLWQYLAVGKPVVVTSLPAIEDWTFPDAFVYRATSEDQFVESVFQAFREDDASLAAARVTFAADNSWAVRARRLMDAIDQAIAAVGS